MIGTYRFIYYVLFVLLVFRLNLKIYEYKKIILFKLNVYILIQLNFN